MAHQTKDILIVDADATVTPVSGEAPTVTGATVEIHTEDVETESFMLDESICTEDNLKFGLCDSSKVEITVRNKSEIPNLNGFETPLNIYIYLNGDSDTLFQIGQYLCDKDEYINERRLRKLVLYDVLYELNDLDITSWYNQYFADGNRHEIIWVIADLFKWINGTSPYDNDSSSPKINLELDSEYILCNGMFPIGKTIESDTITFSFFMQGILEFNGSFGHITREGKFKIVTMEWYDKDPVRVVTDDYRKPPTSYADEATWGIGGIDVYDRDNTIKFQIRNTDKKRPSIYVLLDPWIIADREAGDSYTKTALERLQSTIHHFNYTPSETECSGDLCVEVGDRIDVRFTKKSAYDTRNKFRSYVLERHFSGIQSMHDTYTSKGSKKQPAYQTGANWHIGDSETATTGKGTGGVSEVDMEHDRRLIQVLRNGGYRFLDEPSGVSIVYNKAQSQVEIKWTDPSDITDYKPLPAEWVGTCLIRKEGSAPLHRWDGELLVRSNTRNEYSSTAYVDDTIESNKKYYYSIMPYYIALDDEYHPVRYYTWTKIVSVDTARILVAPTLFPIQETSIQGTDVTVGYSIPELSVGTYEVMKLVAKKDAIPTSISDCDKAIDLTPTPGMIVNTSTMTGLDKLSHYYFMVFVEDEEGNGASSEPQDCTTGADLGYNFPYSGEVVEWTVPKTGYYSLETWGAQGGEATDGTNSARGGYGAYAYGEVLLTRGEKLYINVGGQNGYGGGGNSLVNNLMQISGVDWLNDIANSKTPSLDPHDYGSIVDGAFVSSATTVYRYETAFAKENFIGNKIITVEARLYYAYGPFSYDFDLLFYKTSDSSTSGRLVRLIFANGQDESFEAIVFFNGYPIDYEGVLDLEQYRNSWHTVKFVLHIENSKFADRQIYIDDVLIHNVSTVADTDLDTFIGNDTVKTRFIVLENAKVDYVNINVQDA